MKTNEYRRITKEGVTLEEQKVQELLNEKMKLNDLCTEYRTKYIGLKTIMDFANN